MTSKVTLETILEAHDRIRPYVHKTPLLSCSSLTKLANEEIFKRIDENNEKEQSSEKNHIRKQPRIQLFFKCEAFQKTGSFKARGACNAIHYLCDHSSTIDNISSHDGKNEIKDFVTHSSGNHAQALAWAATTRNIAGTGSPNCVSAHIVMPNNAPVVKSAAVKGYGAFIYECEPTQEARQNMAQNLIEKIGGTFVHPSEDPLVISGQGTVGLEILEQMKEISSVHVNDSTGQVDTNLDLVVIPVGGGGLASGIATAIKALSPSTIVICAEPEIANDAYRSKQSGTLCGHDKSTNLHQTTIADGLKTTLGPNTFDIVTQKVDHIFTVTEAEIAKATTHVWERMKVAIEPSAGVGIGMVLFNKDFHSFMKTLDNNGKRIKNIAVVLCGGNIDLSKVDLIRELASTMF